MLCDSVSSDDDLLVSTRRRFLEPFPPGAALCSAFGWTVFRVRFGSHI